MRPVFGLTHNLAFSIPMLLDWLMAATTDVKPSVVAAEVTSTWMSIDRYR